VKKPGVPEIVGKENESLGLMLVRDQETDYIAAGDFLPKKLEKKTFGVLIRNRD
jgi:hypothetical protein